MQCPVPRIGRALGSLALFTRAPGVERYQSFESVHATFLSQAPLPRAYVMMRLGRLAWIKSKPFNAVYTRIGIST
jgi:hypothetical protein